MLFVQTYVASDLHVLFLQSKGQNDVSVRSKHLSVYLRVFVVPTVETSHPWEYAGETSNRESGSLYPHVQSVPLPSKSLLVSGSLDTKAYRFGSNSST